MSFSNLNPSFDRMLRGLATAADPQPWRCSGCNTPVRPHRNDPCKCVAPWDGREVTVGISTPPHRVTPRIVGAANVERTKRLLGCCMEPGCTKVARHAGEHS